MRSGIGVLKIVNIPCLIYDTDLVNYITSYTMGFYEIPLDIRAIFWYFSVFQEPKNYENITGISSKHMV